MSATIEARTPTFFEELREQRWDDHRHYHQSRVNQSLHLLSACCFLVSYALIPISPIAAALLGWVVAMWIRQIGHFFFEPRGYDTINKITFADKEAIKVGFNLKRKVVLLAAWLTIPAVLWLSPSLFGTVRAHAGWPEYLDRVGVAWLWLAACGLLARTVWLCATRNVQTGVVWLTKIFTDPVHDILLYRHAPLALLRGERLDPMTHVAGRR